MESIARINHGIVVFYNQLFYITKFLFQFFVLSFLFVIFIILKNKYKNKLTTMQLGPV